jgi:hypothetical protein
VVGVDPLLFLVGGLGLLLASLVIVGLNRSSARADNPYDDREASLNLDAALWSIRHADVQYHDGLALGRRLPARSAEDLQRGLNRLGIGEFEIVPAGKRRHEVHVREGPFAGSPAVEEPLCFLTLGILRGAFENVLKRDVRVEEERCAGTGSGECVFNVEVMERETRTTFTRVA